jgi:outer membrane protein insertion porin family
MPKQYEIADIKVTGNENYEEFIVIGYSGLKKGDIIEVPGSEISTAAKRLMKQGLFAQAQIKVEKVAGNKVWLEIALRTQPRISEINYIGVKKSEKEDLQERLQLMKGNQITQNIVNRATKIIEKYFDSKGFSNASVKIDLREDLSKKNEMIVDINIDKNNKMKVHKIYLTGNEVLTDKKIKRAMKKTNEKNNILELFNQKKFVETDYEDDLNRIIEKYNEYGYRDAKIVADSVVQFDEKTVDVYITIDEGKKYYIKDINWVGNTLYSSQELSNVLGILPGEVYTKNSSTSVCRKMMMPFLTIT